jgi:predicted dinucleotide-binding enzyme
MKTIRSVYGAGPRSLAGDGAVRRGRTRHEDRRPRHRDDGDGARPALLPRRPRRRVRLALARTGAHGGGRREARVGQLHEGALVGSDLVALALTWPDVGPLLSGIGVWSGRILLDCTNPEPPSGRGLLLGHSTSGAEQIAKGAAGARVVKALNHLYAEALDALRRDGAAPRPVAFYCGDEDASKEVVASLLDGVGLRPVDAGPLASARYLEPLAALMVELVRGRGRAPVEAARLVDAPRQPARV